MEQNKTNQPIKRANICRWLERVFPEDLANEDKAKLDIQLKRNDSLGCIMREKENLFAPKIGTIVDIATNLVLYGYKREIMHDVIKAMMKIERDLEEHDIKWWWDAKKGFRYCKYDYRVMVEEDFGRMGELRTEVEEKGVTARAISLINYFVKYLDFARQGYKNLWKTIEADEATIENIRIMVARTVDFLQGFKDVQGSLMFKESSMCKNINTGSVDFYTEDVMIDIKVKSTAGIWDRDIRQMMVYYLLGKKNGYDFKRCVIFNPRLGEWHEFETKNIPTHLMEEIEDR